MADLRLDPRAPIDRAINTPGREGLTGTASTIARATTILTGSRILVPKIIGIMTKSASDGIE